MRCDSLGEDWYLAQAHVENMISGLYAVKYSREPIIHLYIVWSTCFPVSSWPICVVGHMGVEHDLQSFNENLFDNSFTYLD